MPDTAALAGRGLSEVLLHHIILAEPNRLCAFGKSILPLLGHGMAQKPETLQEINHSHSTTALFVADGLESVMGSPALKRRFWQRWTQWLDGTSL
jgi:DNA polymerase